MEIALLFLMLLGLLATLNLSLGSRPIFDRHPVFRVLTHPGWLTPHIFVGPYLIGLMMLGHLSPWPPLAMQQASQLGGSPPSWAVACGVLTVDLWLLWTGAMVFRKTAVEAEERAFWQLHLFNFMFGAVFIAAVVLLSAPKELL